MHTINNLEKDLKHYKECLEKNTNHCITWPIFEEIESIKNKINYILFREKFEKKKD